MIKCPKCGEEYSLGRKIYHSCEGFSMYHGALLCGDRIERPWNCGYTTKENNLKLKVLSYLDKIKKALVNQNSL
jgi:hypothetical protein